VKAPRTSAGTPHAEHGGAYTVEAFAAAHGISRSQTFKEIASGRLPARKVGSRTIITSEDAAKWRRSLPRVPVNGAPKKPSDGLPVWLSEPRPTRRRGRSKASSGTFRSSEHEPMK
jgi:hypothetical protein